MSITTLSFTPKNAVIYKIISPQNDFQPKNMFSVLIIGTDFKYKETEIQVLLFV